MGTLRVLTDTGGRVIKEIWRDSFGLQYDDTLPDLFMPIGFAGGLHDRDTGLIRFGWRDYDPSVGRFAAPDPAKDRRGDGDIYDYCVDDPVSRVDPTGLWTRETFDEGRINRDTIGRFSSGEAGGKRLYTAVSSGTATDAGGVRTGRNRDGAMSGRIIEDLVIVAGKESIEDIAREVEAISFDERHRAAKALEGDPGLRNNPDKFNRYIALTNGPDYLRDLAALYEERKPHLAIMRGPKEPTVESMTKVLAAERADGELCKRFDKAHQFAQIFPKEFQDQEERRRQAWKNGLTTPAASKTMLRHMEQVNAAQDQATREKLLMAMLQEASRLAGMPEGNITFENLVGENGKTRGTNVLLSSSTFIHTNSIDFDFLFVTLFHEKGHVVQNIMPKAVRDALFGGPIFSSKKAGIETPYRHSRWEQHPRFLSEDVGNITSDWHSNAGY